MNNSKLKKNKSVFFFFILKETPGPTAYNVPFAYENLVRVKMEAPRNKNAQKRHESFTSAAKRDLQLHGNQDVPGMLSN